MLINKLLNFNWGGLGYNLLTYLRVLQLINFMTKQKSWRKIFEWITIYC